MSDSTIFIIRHRANTWIHESQFDLSCDEGEYFGSITRADAAFCAQFSIGPMPKGPTIVKDRDYKPESHAKSGTVHKRGVTSNLIYLDRLHVCPFCGNTTVHRNEDTDDLWKLFMYADFRGVSLSDVAKMQSIARQKQNTKPFHYRMCSMCRKDMRTDPTRRYKQIANSVGGPTDSKWLECKMNAHGLSLYKNTTVALIKKSIKRRMRRKKISKRETEFFTMLLAGSKISSMIK